MNTEAVMPAAQEPAAAVLPAMTATATAGTSLATLQNVGTAALVFDEQNFEKIMRVAEVMASSRATVPVHLRGNAGDCAAVVMQSIQWNMNPYAVAQKTHLVNGTLGYEGQLINAAITSMGVSYDRLNYEWFGDWTKVIGKFTIKKKEATNDKKATEYRVPAWSMADEEGLGIRVWATLKGESEPRMLELLLSQAQVRNSPLWAEDPKQQIAYLAVRRWARLHSPDVILGVYTPEELNEGGIKDINDPAPRRAAPARQSPADALRKKGENLTIDPATEERRQRLIADLKIVAEEEGEEGYTKAWQKMPVADRQLIGQSEHERLWGIAGAKKK